VAKVSYLAVERSDASSQPRIASLAPISGWAPAQDGWTAWRPHFVQPSAEVQRSFRTGGQNVGVFLSYYRNQGTESKLVSSDNRLIKADDHTWVRAAGGKRTITLNGRPLEVRTSELRGPGGQEILLWQWYWINGYVTSSDYWAKAYTALARLQGRGDDSAAILVYTSRERFEAAEKSLEAFVAAAGPAIETALQQTRNAR
jgi:EpsI family protein